jgi:hypothetical protein
VAGLLFVARDGRKTPVDPLQRSWSFQEWLKNSDLRKSASVCAICVLFLQN